MHETELVPGGSL